MKLPSDRLPAVTRPGQPSFTLVELIAATAVLSVVLLMMVGMQDQMSKAWGNATRRTDATREARSACRMMAEDLSSLYYRPMAGDNQANLAAGLENQGVPFLYSSNGQGSVIISNAQPGSAYFFGLCTRKPSAANSADLATIGFYVAFTAETNINGFVSTNYHLYRHYVPAAGTMSNLSRWFSSSVNARVAGLLFQPNPSTDDVLARNTCNLRITAYNRPDGNTKGWGNQVTNGLNYQFVGGGSTTFYSGSKLQLEISVYPDEYAQRIPYAQWNNSNNIRKYARSYEFRVDIPRE